MVCLCMRAKRKKAPLFTPAELLMRWLAGAASSLPRLVAQPAQHAEAAHDRQRDGA